MGIISNLVNRFLSGTWDRHDEVRNYIKKKYSNNKYWKNFNKYESVDNIDLTVLSKKEAATLLKLTRIEHANEFDLVLNPAIKSISFDLWQMFPMSKPTVCFISQNSEPYSFTKENGKTVTITEVSRIFIKANPSFKALSSQKDKTIAEARYVLVEDEKATQLVPVVVSIADEMKEAALEGIFRSAIATYMGIQYMAKNKPTVFKTPQIQSSEEPEKANKEPEPERREAEFQRVVYIKDEKEDEVKKAGNEIKCTAWGVSGHYRHLKDGRVIWIKPYIKGKDRDKPEAYNAKTYKFAKEHL